MERELATPFAQSRANPSNNSPYSANQTPNNNRGGLGRMDGAHNSRSQVNLAKLPKSMPAFNTIEATQSFKKVII